MNYSDSLRHPDTAPSDFDFDDADTLSAKSALVLKLNALIVSRGLSEAEAAALAEMARPVVTPEQRERIRNVSLDLLMHTLVSFWPACGDRRAACGAVAFGRYHGVGLTTSASASRQSAPRLFSTPCRMKRSY
ncbi:XRE family transcriptional regulator [Burkholderia ambifaria]|uniref:XRE family transcriptional regulator n=1 Tax=Burkholderia ambifaria TaxID=152480 RepID=UPI00347BE6AB